MNQPLDNFSAQASGNVIFTLEDFRGKYLVLYFYPKDNTPGCSIQAQQFAENYQQFKKYNTEIVGVSRDSLASHEKFIKKYTLPFLLISDSDEKVCHQFDVIKEKNMFGKKVRGIQRSTFLINPEGIVVQEWRKVKIPGHVAAVLATCQEIN